MGGGAGRLPVALGSHSRQRTPKRQHGPSTQQVTDRFGVACAAVLQHRTRVKHVSGGVVLLQGGAGRQGMAGL
eukprot:scaffold32391_cov56-Isochrysis_galbana.AAC.1